MRASLIPLCSSLAVATALLFPGSAAAQSFLGKGSVVKGSADIEHLPSVSSNPPRTNVRVYSDQVVINWSASGPVANGVQLFQDAGTEALFQNDRGVGEFAVLNRILPSQAGAKIAINGFVRSIVGEGSGGTIFFYTPNGLVLGSTARIDVGRLGLTTADPWDGKSDSWLNGKQVTFHQALPGSSIAVNAGATIIASPREGSYVAMVAPTIAYAGTTRVNGQAALVAAEAATITFNPNGLFDIQVTVGSGGAGEKITSSGDITGLESSGPGDNHRIYMVAVPKNDAISLALSGGKLGFDLASKAEVVGNAIVLSAGHNISGGAIEAGAAKAANASASIELSPAEVTSALFAKASDSIRLEVAEGTSRYHSDVDLAARNLVRVSAGTEGLLQFDQGLSASADWTGSGGEASVTGGRVELLAQDGGRVEAGGPVGLSANAHGSGEGTARGGDIIVQARNGGEITLAGKLDVQANGLAGPGGNARSGTVALSALGGEVRLTTASLQADATADQGDAVLSEGAIRVLVSDGQTPGQRGRLTGGSVTGVAEANGGTSISSGGSGLEVRNGDLDLASLSLSVKADSEQPSAVSDVIFVSGGTAKVGSLSLATSGRASLFVDNGLLDVGKLTLDAADFVADEEPPASAGLVRAQSANISTAADFRTSANMAVASAFALTAPGSISIADLTGGSSLTLSAQSGSVDLVDVQASGTLSVTAGGTIGVNGQWSGPLVSMESGDIAIGANGGITSAGELSLRSTNVAGMTLGVGVGGTGYLLDNAEFGKLEAASILLAGRSDSSAAQDLVIGKLDVAGSQIGPDGTLGIATFGEGGVIRIVGEVAATGFDSDQTVAFSTGLFQLDAATGSIGLTGSGETLAGLLEISADRVHVAEAAILAKLVADPLYAGRAEELNQAAAVQRPEGVLRAADITVFGANQLLVQNVGTKAVPAGILAADGDIIASASSAAALASEEIGPVEMIINGQIAGAGGTVTGPAVWQAVTTDPDFNFALFTGSSSINGCVLTAASCGDPAPPPVIDPPRPDSLGEEPALADKLFTREETACASSATDALVARCDLESDLLIEEPVAGSGNPALVGDAEGDR